MIPTLVLSWRERTTRRHKPSVNQRKVDEKLTASAQRIRLAAQTWSNVMSHKSESPSTLLKQINKEYKNSFLPIVLSHNQLDALLAVRPDLRYWRGKGKHCLVFASPPVPIKKDPSSRPNRLGMTNGRLKMLRALPLEEKIALAYRVLDRMFAVTDAIAVAFSGGRDSL